jgi:hypothetical protein
MGKAFLPLKQNRTLDMSARKEAINHRKLHNSVHNKTAARAHPVRLTFSRLVVTASSSVPLLLLGKAFGANVVTEAQREKPCLIALRSIVC